MRSQGREWARRMLLWELRDGPRDEREIRTASETRWDPEHKDGPRYRVASCWNPASRAWRLNGKPPRVPWDVVEQAAADLGISMKAGTIYREGGRGEGRFMWKLPPERVAPNGLPPDVTEGAQVCQCERPVPVSGDYLENGCFTDDETRCLNCARLVPALGEAA